MQIMSLITALPGAAAQGLIWGIMRSVCTLHSAFLILRILPLTELYVQAALSAS